MVVYIKGLNRLYLTQSLIKNNPGTHGQIEAADVRIGHRNGITAVAVQRKHFFWQSLGFPTENKKVARLEGRLPVGPLNFGGEKEEPALVLLGKEGCQVWPVLDAHLRPVVQPGPLQVLVIRAESERMNKMKH